MKKRTCTSIPCDNLNSTSVAEERNKQQQDDPPNYESGGLQESHIDSATPMINIYDAETRCPSPIASTCTTCKDFKRILNEKNKVIEELQAAKQRLIEANIAATNTINLMAKSMFASESPTRVTPRRYTESATGSQNALQECAPQPPPLPVPTPTTSIVTPAPPPIAPLNEPQSPPPSLPQPTTRATPPHGVKQGQGAGKKGGNQCILCGTYYTSRNILNHFKTKHPSYLNGRLRDHPDYPVAFYFRTPCPRERCPKELRPPKSAIRGVSNVDSKFLESDSDETDSDS